MERGTIKECEEVELQDEKNEEEEERRREKRKRKSEGGDGSFYIQRP